MATIFLDHMISGDITDGTYSIAGRSGGGSDGNAYKTLASLETAIAGGDQVYLRAGTYVRNTGGTQGAVSQKGALEIPSTASGTAQNRTKVDVYNDEAVTIGTDNAKLQYNPDPGDTSGVNSSGYYPCPAIGVRASFCDLNGGTHKLKTFGCCAVHNCNDVVVEGCDIGGGGPHISQGMAFSPHTTYNLTVRNNKIHHSCWGESSLNGPGLQGYEFSAIIENNEFYDNWGADCRLKDQKNQQGRETIVRYNIFRPSTLTGAVNQGFIGVAQFPDVDLIKVYQNIFIGKSAAIVWAANGTTGTNDIYNNTLVDCDIYVDNGFGAPIKVHNNIFYHPTGGSTAKYYEMFGTHTVDADWNVYYQDGGRWKYQGSTATTLAQWKTNSGDEGDSLSHNPNFIDATELVDPTKFKRSSVTENFTASTYSTVAGAYITGNETIGLLTGGAGDVTHSVNTVTLTLAVPNPAFAMGAIAHAVTPAVITLVVPIPSLPVVPSEKRSYISFRRRRRL